MHRYVRFIITLLCCAFLLSSCATPPSLATPTTSLTSTATTAPGKTVSQPTPTATRPTAAPVVYNSRILLSGGARPDDLAFDTKGNLLFSDFYNGTISRLNANDSVTVIQRNIAGPEGLVVLSDGTMIIAEQRSNRILTLAPGAARPTVLRTLPGTPSTANCKDGVDGIAFDSATNSLIIPDSPGGTVYRLSLDGKNMRLLASGITRPVGAAVDERGNIFVADECGAALWRIAPDGTRSRMGSFGKRETLYSAGLIEPQGLAIDNHDNIYFSDDYADVIVKLSPRG